MLIAPDKHRVTVDKVNAVPRSYNIHIFTYLSMSQVPLFNQQSGRITGMDENPYKSPQGIPTDSSAPPLLEQIANAIVFCILRSWWIAIPLAVGLLAIKAGMQLLDK
jgi:hypothetical protein